MDFMPKASAARLKPASEWAQLIAAHGDVIRRYRAAADAAQAEPALEDEADGLLRELTEIENQALAWPAADAGAFRFKLTLWADGRVEGYEAEWRVFAHDCERLLLESGKLS